MKEHTGPVTRIHTDMVPRYFLIFLLCIGFNSCKSQINQASEDNGLILLAQNGYSAIESFESMVVKDQKTLNGFYAKINKTRKPGLPVPKIDFAKEMVIVVCMGEQLGEDLPDLAHKSEDAERIFLQINPNDSKKVGHTTLVSSPFCVYKMPLTSKEIVFVKD